jgi:hypothetical protein
VRQVLKVLGMITGIAPLVMALRTGWDSFDCYGTVPAGERAIVELPAGPISIAFESGSRYSKATKEDLPKIVDMRGRELPATFMSGLQGPTSTRTGMHTGDVMRKRFASAEVPTDGDYAITGGACALLIGTAGFSRKPRPVPNRALAEATR